MLTKKIEKKTKRIRPGWYTGVGPKRSKEWDKRTRMLILKLRDKGVTPKEIAEDLETTVTSVHNQTRVARCSVLGICFQCRRPLPKVRPGIPERCDHCKQEHADYKKDLSKDSKKRGICIACRKHPAVPGRSYCTQCLSATYRRRIKEGICGTCGLHPVSKKSESQCTACLKLNRESKREKRQASKS